MARGHRVPARARHLIVAAALLLGAGACADAADDGGSSAPAGGVDATATGGDAEPATGGGPEPAIAGDAEAGEDGLFPDVVDAVAVRADDGTWRFDVTLSSPYDTAERYADAWRVLSPDGDELGVRVLLHDHQNEQPFTRSLSGVVVPDGVTTVTIEGRDQVNGWGGQTIELELP